MRQRTGNDEKYEVLIDILPKVCNKDMLYFVIIIETCRHEAVTELSSSKSSTLRTVYVTRYPEKLTFDKFVLE